MASAARSECTECHLEVRPAHIQSFSMCSKHHLCRDCVGRRGPQTAATKGKCPVCDEARRRIGTQVRNKIWSEERVNRECVGCRSYGTGALLMLCGHAYCVTCLRQLPKSFQTRNVQGGMAKRCRDCDKKATEELREQTRAAMEAASLEAQVRRDERETREFREDRRAGPKPVKRLAPKTPKTPKAAKDQGFHETAARALTVAAGPSFLEKDSEGNVVATKAVWVKMPKKEKATPRRRSPATSGAASADGAAADKENRRVSFDPVVQQRCITPRGAKKRWSGDGAACASSTGPASGGQRGLRLSVNSNVLPGVGEGGRSMFDLPPLTPVDGHRTFARGWSISCSP